jgi:hypothetical protein
VAVDPIDDGTKGFPKATQNILAFLMCAVGYLGLLWGGGALMIYRNIMGIIAGMVAIFGGAVILIHGFRALVG